MSHYKVFTDGGSRGNPGPAAIGFVIYDIKGNVIVESSKYIGTATNNVAEYTALYLSIIKLNDLKFESADFYLDSELIVKQMNGQYQIKNNDLKKIFDKIQKELKNKKYKFSHIKREKNKHADYLVNLALDREKNKNG